jgi:hypothetical protein
MVNIKMFNKLQGLNVLVIYVGDWNQLNPVKEGVSKVFELDKKFSLVENMRIRNNRDSLSAMYLNEFKQGVIDPHKKITVNRIDLNFLVETFKTGDCIILAWTNKQVQYWNNFIREKLFLKDVNAKLEKFYINEKLIFSGYRHINDDLKYYSSDIIDIKDLEEVKLKVPYVSCECYEEVSNKIKKCDKCGIKGHYNKFAELDYYKIVDQNGIKWFIVKNNCLNKLKTIITEFKNYCIIKKNVRYWKQYYEFRNMYNPDLRASYALTVHKAQGSEWHKVFVDVNNLRMNRNPEESSRLLYTAVSRYIDYVYFI